MHLNTLLTIDELTPIDKDHWLVNTKISSYTVIKDNLNKTAKDFLESIDKILE